MDRRCLAGSAIGLNRALHVFMEFGAGSLADAVRAATRNAADLLQRRGVCSHIAKGQPANLVLFRIGARELKVQGVILGGELVYGRN
jgi:N-acetylglucosamine-6-phosphate deacetylase